MKRYFALIVLALMIFSCNTQYATDSQNYRLGYERGMRQGYDQGFDAAQYGTGYNFMMPTYRQGSGYQMYNSRYNNGGNGGYSETYGADNYYDNSGTRRQKQTKPSLQERKNQSIRDKAKNGQKVKTSDYNKAVNKQYKPGTAGYKKVNGTKKSTTSNNAVSFGKPAAKKSTSSISKKKKPVRKTITKKPVKRKPSISKKSKKRR